MAPFRINFLDHVALRVQDQEQSVRWYEKVLGLQRADFPRWGDYPVLMGSGRFGVALFPANPDDPALDQHSKNVRIDHFAFNVDPEEFARAQAHFARLGLAFEFQDHVYYHSIYTKDPDGHTVELTTRVLLKES